MHIAVIGGGIVGMSTAWRLTQDGHRVTVIDKAEEAGRGTSFANAGQLSYSYVAPLADSTIWGQLPKLLLDPKSPVRFRPGFDLFQYRWLLSFLAACNVRQATRTIDRLGALAELSKTVLHGSEVLRSRQFAWTQTGKLVVYSSQKSFEHARHYAEHQAQSGTDKRAFDVEQCLSTEPALASIAGRLVGGLFSPGDEAGDAYLLSKELAALIDGTPGGSRFMGKTNVSDFVREDRRIVAVKTDSGLIEADAFIISAGSSARALARKIGIDLPIYPLKGYSLTAPIKQQEATPSVSITDAAYKVAYARIGDELRLAGAADLVGPSLELDTKRINMLMETAQAAFPQAADWSQMRAWAGLRPATPTGMPIIGRTGFDNLLVNVGHGALGFTLALGSAELLAAQIAGRQVPVPLEYFSLQQRCA